MQDKCRVHDGKDQEPNDDIVEEEEKMYILSQKKADCR